MAVVGMWIRQRHCPLRYQKMAHRVVAVEGKKIKLACRRTIDIDEIEPAPKGKRNRLTSIDGAPVLTCQDCYYSQKVG